MDEPTVRHEPQQGRFSVHKDDHEAYMEYQQAGEGVVDFTHTFTPEELRGQGLAGKIVSAALDWARENDLQVIPTCSYVQSYLERHEEEYGDLRADS